MVSALYNNAGHTIRKKASIITHLIRRVRPYQQDLFGVTTPVSAPGSVDLGVLTTPNPSLMEKITLQRTLRATATLGSILFPSPPDSNPWTVCSRSRLPRACWWYLIYRNNCSSLYLYLYVAHFIKNLGGLLYVRLHAVVWRLPFTNLQVVVCKSR